MAKDAAAGPADPTEFAGWLEILRDKLCDGSCEWEDTLHAVTDYFRALEGVVHRSESSLGVRLQIFFEPGVSTYKTTEWKYLMSALSIVCDGRKVVTLVANPIFLTSPLVIARGAQLSFEILEANSAGLKKLLGSKQLYYLDDQLFWAELISLKSCKSTHPALELLRRKATLRGVFSILGDSDAVN